MVAMVFAEEREPLWALLLLMVSGAVQGGVLSRRLTQGGSFVLLTLLTASTLSWGDVVAQGSFKIIDRRFIPAEKSCFKSYSD